MARVDAALEKFKLDKPVDRLICNAAVYQPSLPYAKWSVDGHEQQMQINYLSHFLMVSLLLPDMSRANDARVILVGSVTGNDNTVGGGGVYPIADLKRLEGLKVLGQLVASMRLTVPPPLCAAVTSCPPPEVSLL